MTYLAPMDVANPDAPLVRADADTAFILGNGPSLASVSLPALSGHATIGLNAAYRYWREIDWRPRYYACVDLVVGLSHKEAIAELIREGRIERFLLRDNLIEALGETARDLRAVNFDAMRAREPLLAVDPPTTGSHAALWAASMGYKTIVMLGVDARYREVVAGAERRPGIELEIVEEADNPNYFFKGYQAPGDRYNLPNPRPDLHVTAWREAGAALAGAGVRVFNANEASAVKCFPYIDFRRFMTDGASPRPAKEAPPAPRRAETAAPGSARARLTSFAAAYAGKALALAAAVAAAFAVWAIFVRPSPAFVIFAAVAAVALYAAGLGVFYVRYSILAHLRRQDEEISALKARMADAERMTRGGPPASPGSGAA